MFSLRLLASLVILWASAANASDSEGNFDWTTLSQHSQWRTLLHYDKDHWLTPPHSAVLDDDFFLSEAGHTDPRAELIATYRALHYNDPAEDAAHCRFPARALWLARHTDADPTALDTCSGWQDWKERNEDTSTGLVFATGYLGNPASFFGHLLLHLDSGPVSAHESGNRLLDTSLNFGADVPPEDGILTYMAKGVFGGYHALFSQAPFYRNSTLYNEREMRDLWHYELNLSSHQQQILVAHLYEIMGRNYRYLFLTDNCASRIARLLDLVTDEPVSNSFALWVDPESVVRAINEASINGQPAVSKVTHIPSRRLITENHFNALTPPERVAATQLASGISTLDLASEAYTGLEEQSRQPVLEALGSYTAYRRSLDSADNLKHADQALLAARLALPPGEALPEFDSPKPVTDIPSGIRLQMKGSFPDNGEAGSVLSFRPMLYDLLESSPSRMPNASLEILSAQLYWSGHDLSVRKLDLFNVTNLYNNPLPRPESTNLAWHASAGWKQSALDCHGCLDRHVSVLAGKSLETGNHLVYVMAGAQLRSEKYFQGAAAAAMEAGYLGQFGARHSLLVTTRHQNSFASQDSGTSRLDVEYRLELGRHHDLRIQFSSDTHSQRLEAGFSWYL
ncbi:MAG: DUF4105 domain-containing protein [Pseudohongiellaceae bacterium]